METEKINTSIESEITIFSGAGDGNESETKVRKHETRGYVAYRMGPLSIDYFTAAELRAIAGELDKLNQN